MLTADKKKKVVKETKKINVVKFDNGDVVQERPNVPISSILPQKKEKKSFLKRGRKKKSK